MSEVPNASPEVRYLPEREVKGSVFDYIAATSAAQAPNDTTFKPEAERLSVMYSEAGIIGNMSIVDFSAASGIAVDYDGDGRADDQLDREEFINSGNVHADNMHMDMMADPGLIIEELGGNRHREIRTNGSISTFDADGTLVNQKTLYDLPQGGVGYEEIKLNPYGGVLGPLQPPTAEITDIFGMTAEAKLNVQSGGDIELTVGDRTRVLNRQGELEQVKEHGAPYLIFDQSKNAALYERGYTITAPAYIHFYSSVDGRTYNNTEVFSITPDATDVMHVSGANNTPIRMFHITADNAVNVYWPQSTTDGAGAPPLQ